MEQFVSINNMYLLIVIKLFSNNQKNIFIIWKIINSIFFSENYTIIFSYILKYEKLG